MFELIGLVFGGLSRLGQHWLEMQDKQRERSHEAVMYDKQIELSNRRFEHDASLRRMDAQSAEVAGDFEILRAAMESQAAEAKAAGGWVLSLSASVRPVLSYWFAAIYTMAKFAGFYLALQSGVPFAEAVRATYTEFDGTILASILSFYFADRSLRKGRA